MAGVKRDLGAVATGCRRIAPLLDNIENIFDVDGWIAALARYGRCFKDGARNAFNLNSQGWIEDLSPELREVHKDAIALRDKHIAHSVNDWEINEVIARVRFEEGQAPQVLLVQPRIHFTVMPDPEFLLAVAEVASILADRLDHAMAEEAARLLQFVKTLPAEELSRRRNAPPRVPGQGHLLKTRKRKA